MTATAPTLRPYQVEAVEALRAEYARGARAPLFQLPTGGGKTVVFAAIARAAAARGTRVLILVHRRELLLQGSAALRSIGLSHGLIAPTLPPTSAQVRIASVQTLVRRLECVTPPDLVVIDEAHHAVAGSWRRVLEHWSAARVLGVTATPARLDGKGLGVQHGGPFDALVTGPSVAELTLDGFLAPATLYQPPQVVDLDGVRTLMGDYDRKQVRVRMDRPKITGDAVEHYQRLGRGQQGIAFCASIDHALHVAEAFTAAGIPAEVLDGKQTTAQRDAVLARLRAGETRILTSCELVSEGFDLPAVTVAILLRPTQSLTVYLQQVGRVLRPAEGKDAAIIIDHVGNSTKERHGPPWLDRTWSLAGAAKRRTADPTKRCPECFAVHDPAPACPACGHVYVVAPPTAGGRAGPDQVAGSLQRVENDLWDEVAARARRQRMEQGAAQTYEALVELGRQRGYAKPEGWAARVWASRQMNTNRRAVALGKAPSAAGAARSSA